MVMIRATMMIKAKVFELEDEFLAVPGHVVGIRKNSGTIQVACGKGMLEVQEIEVDGKTMAPVEYIKSIRVRFKPNHHV